MLVQMLVSRSVVYAHRKLTNTPLTCGVCRRNIQKGMVYTLHQAPIYRGKEMQPYAACSICAPCMILERNTGELDLKSYIQTERKRAEQAYEDIETEILPAIPRTGIIPRKPHAARLVKKEHTQ
jgi:hypothetical protein